jgi:hypothetical protein
VYVLTNTQRCVYVIERVGWERFNNRYPLYGEPGPGPARVDNRYDEEVWRVAPPPGDGNFRDAEEGW